ncbi:hypothetical protein Droror1_Dr00027643 [Drosera rotundifolia]
MRMSYSTSFILVERLCSGKQNPNYKDRMMSKSPVAAGGSFTPSDGDECQNPRGKLRIRVAVSHGGGGGGSHGGGGGSQRRWQWRVQQRLGVSHGGSGGGSHGGSGFSKDWKRRW